MRRAAAAGICLAISAAAGVARAEPSATGQPHELRHDVATDAVVTVTSVILVVGAELGKPDIAPRTCAWCEPPGIDRAARDALRWSSTKTAAHLSDAMGLLAAPAADFGLLWAAGRDGGATGGQEGVDALLLAESVFVSGLANEIVKNAVGRERPFVWALDAGAKSKTPHPADNELSFYSGHTSSTFTAAAAGGTIAALRGYRLAPAIFATGGAIGAFTGYLRIAADKHWLTDVLVGAAVGIGVGILVPVAFHGRRTSDVPSPVVGPPSPATFTLGGAF